jgi:hypothetical protein
MSRNTAEVQRCREADRCTGRRKLMPITMTWMDDKKSVIQWVIEGDFSGDDVVTAIRGYADMVAKAKPEHDFYILLDLSNATGNAFRVLGRFPELARALPPPERRARAIVAIGSSHALDMVTRIFSEVYGGKFVYFTDADKAWAYLNEEMAS